MHATGTIAYPGELSERQRAALLKLLGDEDPAVARSVSEKIIARGAGTLEWLRPHTLSNDPLVRRRTQAIVRHFGRQEADDRFLAFCLRNGEDFSLEEAVWLLARTKYPDINPAGYSALLDNFADILGARLHSPGGVRDVLGVVNDYLFSELGFAGNEEDYYAPENSYLNRVMDDRTGNPISLCTLYLFIARRLKLPVAGISLPGHFVCRYQSTAAEIYVDVFGRGKLLAKADCIQYLVQRNFSVKEEHLAPASPRRMLMRMCGNLHQIYLQLHQPDEATRIQRYLLALAG